VAATYYESMNRTQTLYNTVQHCTTLYNTVQYSRSSVDESEWS